jgi:hypothetical protein
MGDIIAENRRFWMHGGRCLLYLLGPTVHGRNTPVPPRPILLLMLLEGAITIGLAGATIIMGAARTAIPHAGASMACGAGP